MSSGFVQGTKGEVKFLDVVPTHLQGANWTRDSAERYAADYESKNPNVLVIRPWEEVSDEVFAASPDDRKAQILKDRAALKIRREKRKASAVEIKQKTISGDPERLARELKRKRMELHSLGSDHPDYDRLWKNLTTFINELEEAIGVEVTKYVKGEAVEKQSETPIDPKFLEAIERYKKASKEKRRNAILNSKTAEWLRLMRDNEPDEELQALAVERLMQEGALV